VHPTARLTTVTMFNSKTMGMCRSMTRDPNTGHVFLGFETFGSSNRSITVMEFHPPTGAFVRTVASFRSWNPPEGMTIVGSRHLVPTAAPTPGTAYPIRVSFPGEQGAIYVMALSPKMRPGIRVAGGRMIHLFPGPFFFWSLSDSVTFPGFGGRLDAKGEAAGRVRLPNLPHLRGRRFFVAAVTVDSTGIRSIAQPIGFTVR
jgi:hypothetical protein